MTTENTVKTDLEILAQDPVLKRAMELTKEDVDNTESLVTELLNICMNKLENEGMSIKHIFLSLGKTIAYMSQTMCVDKEHFERELSAANALVIKNIFPALGANAYDNELNASSEVTFNGEFDEENFNIRRLLLLAGALIDYTYWKTNFNVAVTEQVEKEKLEEEKKSKE